MENFRLKKLPYGYNILAPSISEETLKVHHDKHHQAYCDKFNLALDKYHIETIDFEEIFAEVEDMPEIRNNGGGFWNHQFYWESMSNEYNDIHVFANLLDKINASFGSFENFKKEFTQSAICVFGSGWTWLGVAETGKLVIYNTPNQDNFMMDVCPHKQRPILVIDVWEHAYYLDYQNKRADYVEAFFKVINWRKVYERLDE